MSKKSEKPVRRPKYYVMNHKQYDEMRRFYEKLGYDDDQTALLCSSSFGADIEVTSDVSYSEGWRFRLNYRREQQEKRGFFRGMFGGTPASAGRARKSSPMGMMCGGPPPMADMEEPMECMTAMSLENVVLDDGIEMNEPPEFNTVENNAKPENEEYSPLDQAQAIFSANVNTASWTYIRSRIERGRSIDSDIVRVEEIINSYSYDLAPPEDDSLFSVSVGHGDCPWKDGSELMFLGFRARKADEGVRRNIAMLVDVSGSMDDEWILVQMSMAAIMSGLGKGDVLSIISYSDNTKTVAKKISCGNRDELIEALMNVDGIGGCTYGSKGLEDAYSYLKDNYTEDGINRVFIFTDGDFNFGVTSEGGLEKFIYDKRKTGIYLSIIGYGENNFKDNKMEALARNGNGNYTFVSSPADIADTLSRKLLSSMVTVAKDVKISVELNPAFVSSYRLIGYEARMLTQQEFHDTEKAVDGIGSEHNVVALIQFERGKAEQKYKSRYVNVSPSENSDEFAFIEVHYKSPDGEDLTMKRSVTVKELEEAPSSCADTAALLAAFGLLLRGSKYRGDLTKEMLGEMFDKELKERSVTKPEPYSHYAVIGKYLGRDGTNDE